MIESGRQSAFATESTVVPLFPSCGSGCVVISTVATIDVEVEVDREVRDLRVRSELVGDTDWDDANQVRCANCGWHGTVANLAG